METILNELSIKGQFSDEEEFQEYVIHVLKKILDILEEKEIQLYKKMNAFDCNITKDKTLREILYTANNPAVYIIKKAIIQLSFSSPYWDDELEIKSKKEVCYLYPQKTEEPNCLTEAIERKCGIISFPSEDYKTDYISCSRNSVDINIANIDSLERLLYNILLNLPEDIRYVIENSPYKKKVELFTVNKRCYTEEALLNNNLTIHDKIQIVKQIHSLIRDKESGIKSRWWDSITADINEYRISVSDGREFRIFFLWQDRVIFLNGFIKKSQSTPKSEIEKAKKLRQLFTNME